MAAPIGELEVRLLLEAIFDRYHYDFRSYAMASLKRRLAQACDTLHVGTLSGLQEKVLHEPESFSTLLQYLTVQVSDMFRDPEFFAALRTQVLPVLATYPSIKVWVAGCSAGEEAYSLAILLQEEGLLDRSIIYATDINAQALRLAQSGVLRARAAARVHREPPALGRHDVAVRLLSRVRRVGDHGLARCAARSRFRITAWPPTTCSPKCTSSPAATCSSISITRCRTARCELFGDALVSSGFLGLGSKESLRFTDAAGRFTELSAPDAALSQDERTRMSARSTSS